MYKKTVLFFLIISFVWAGCSTAQVTKTENSQTLAPSSTPSPPTATLMPTATPIGGSNGLVITQRLNDFYMLNLVTGEKKLFLSLDEAKPMLPKDRTFDAYGFEPGNLDASLSLDLTKAKITICSKLNKDLNCIFEDLVYDNLNNVVTSLNSTGWQWSPDGSKLASIENVYVGEGVNQEFVSAYLNVINSDGTNFQTIVPLADEFAYFEWHPDGKRIYTYDPINSNFFKEIQLDGAVKELTSSELKEDDLVACLDFSSDGKKIAFAVNSKAIYDFYRIYIASSDLGDVSLITEYSADAYGGCEIDLSPDQRFVFVKHDYKRENGGEYYDPIYTGFNTKTGDSLETPQYQKEYSQDLGMDHVIQDICGWSPDGKLVYTNEQNLIFLNPSTHQETNTSIALGCPLLWLPPNYIDPSPETAWGMRYDEVPTCHAGQATNDPEDSSILNYLDILKGSTIIEGNKLKVTLTLRSVPPEITTVHEFTDTSDIMSFYYYVGIDLDNNIQTGSPDSGQEGEDASIMVSIFQKDGKLFGQVFTSKFGTNELFDSPSELLIDKSNNTITFYGDFPEIDINSYVNFSAYSFDNDTFMGDHLCE
jgi:Tol biopolymer transport system component